jgi:putative SOS response-associated peptidase YedK
LFAFAGLGERWKDPNGNWIRSCSILTTTPNAVTSGIHDRMPVILDPDAHDLWLNVPEQSDDALAQRHKLSQLIPKLGHGQQVHRIERLQRCTTWGREH